MGEDSTWVTSTQNSYHGRNRDSGFVKRRCSIKFNPLNPHVNGGTILIKLNNIM